MLFGLCSFSMVFAINVMQNATCMGENIKFLRRGWRGIFTQSSPLAKNNYFSHNCQANTRWNPLFRSLVLCSFLNDCAALGKISENELLNWTFADSSRSKIFQNMGNYFFFCILSVFLFARFISFSFPVSDPAKCAWLSRSPQRRPQHSVSFLLETVSNHSFLFQMLNQ